MGHHVIEYDEKCDSCKGTGLYVGRGERADAATVCHDCEGTGCHHVRLAHDDFDGRETLEDIQRVFQANPGAYMRTKEGRALSEFGGMPYEDWLAGKPFGPGMEMREFTCPAWWYQSADAKKKPDWVPCEQAILFSECPCFKAKAACWDDWDREFAATPKAKGA